MASPTRVELRGIHDVAAAEQLRLQQQAGQRRPQLVAQHRQEQVLGVVGALRLGLAPAAASSTRCLSASMSTSDRMAPSILLSVVL